jgi:putative spermidine/putrescine transport system substrate-binding protein
MAQRHLRSAVVGLVVLLIAAGTAAAAKKPPTPALPQFPNLSGQKFTWVDAGGAIADAYKAAAIEPFTKRTGVNLAHDFPTAFAKVKAQVDAGNVSWDAMTIEPFLGEKYCGQYFQVLPKDWVDRNHTAGKYIRSRCVIPSSVYSILFLYDKNKFADNPPTSWKDFFDTTKYPGTRGVYANISGNPLEAALLADGVAPDKIFPIDYDRAFRKLDSIKKDISFFTSLGVGAQGITDGRYAMAIMSSPRAYTLLNAGVHYAPVWNGAIESWTGMVIPKGAPNPRPAAAFLNWVSSAPVQAFLAKLVAFGPTSKVVTLPTDPLAASMIPTNPAHKDQLIMSTSWWAAHYDEAVQRFTQWTAG